MHAVRQVVLKQLRRYGLEGRGRRRDLGEYVDALRVLLHQALQAAHLTLDTAKPLEDGVFVVVVPGRRLLGLDLLQSPTI
ncbi:hypothetical protein AQJ46_12110 [Streptomyces canus]|uniref:Uncharacterized protein n=1 Tax=Streptomyces canus TaxID=58343 RepID=A0A117R5R1_9ACTN|nr:hypothetical protein AQJ46_12110 [Streptomyces canus]